MKDKSRIQIDGVWYVKESIQNKKVEIDVTEFIGASCETNNYCWEATMLKRADGTLYDDVMIKFTDKRKDKPWKDEHWDNNNWFKNLLKGTTSSLGNAYEIMDDEGVEQFIEFLKVIEKKGWL